MHRRPRRDRRSAGGAHLTEPQRDVAIIGAGVIGLSIACELRRAGVERVTVLEKEPSVGQGSSARANGGVRAQFTTAINIAFSLYSLAEIERLQEATGLPALRQTGYLFVTADAENAARLRRACELQRSLGVATEWLPPADIIDRAPFIRAEGLIAGTFHARDGYLDPHGLLAAYADEARRLGVELRTDSEVRSLARSDDGFEVEIDDGALRAGWVVNAAGAHARAIAALLDVDVPVEPVRRNLAYVHDPRAPHSPIPMCVDVDTGVLVRREGREGYVIAYSDPNDSPGWDTSLDPRFLEAVAARIANRFPHLEGVPIDPKQCWAGLYPETPDGHAIIGEVPGAPRFVQCVGFGGHGLMHSPAAGRALAELIAHGRCASFDLRPLRPSRFEEGDLTVETAVL